MIKIQLPVVIYNFFNVLNYLIILYSLITDHFILTYFKCVYIICWFNCYRWVHRSLCEFDLYFTFSDPLRILTTSTFDTYTINNHFPWTQTPVNSITFIKDDQYTENHWLCGVVQGSGQACIWSAYLRKGMVSSRQNHKNEQNLMIMLINCRCFIAHVNYREFL